VLDHLPNAEITFDKFHVIAHASKAVDKTRRAEQKNDPDLKGLRARAWLYREQLRDILDRKQVNVVRCLLLQWCVNVMRSKVEPMKEVAKLIRNHIGGIVS
jgi:transposase